MYMPCDVLHIPLGELKGKLAEIPKDKDILTFCKISLRGYEAQRIIKAAGQASLRFGGKAESLSVDTTQKGKVF